MSKKKSPVSKWLLWMPYSPRKSKAYNKFFGDFLLGKDNAAEKPLKFYVTFFSYHMHGLLNWFTVGKKHTNPTMHNRSCFRLKPSKWKLWNMVKTRSNIRKQYFPSRTHKHLFRKCLFCSSWPDETGKQSLYWKIV